MYTRVHNSPKVSEATRVSADGRTGKQNVGRTCTGTLRSLRKEANSDTCYMREPRRQDTKRRKPATKKYRYLHTTPRGSKPWSRKAERGLPGRGAGGFVYLEHGVWGVIFFSLFFPFSHFNYLISSPAIAPGDDRRSGRKWSG